MIDSALFLDEFLYFLNKEYLMDSLTNNTSLTLIYRQLIDGIPTYLSLKVVKLTNDDHIVFANQILISKKKVVVAIGYSDFNEDADNTISEVLKRADSLMYEKNKGKSYLPLGALAPILDSSNNLKSSWCAHTST